MPFLLSYVQCSGWVLMLSEVVGATPTFQEFNITPMSVAWIQWAWKLIYNPNIFLESSASGSVHRIQRHRANAHKHTHTHIYIYTHIQLTATFTGTHRSHFSRWLDWSLWGIATAFANHTSVNTVLLQGQEALLDENTPSLRGRQILKGD